MPIITPAYPSMCATHNVGNSTMAVIQQELEKGAQITDEIMVGRRPWKDLFTKHTFFTNGFKYYLTVISSSRTKQAQNAWSGFIESRVRLLVNKLEMHPDIVLARPFNKGYDRVHRVKDDRQLEEVVGQGSLAYLYKAANEADKVKGMSKPEPKQDATMKQEIKTEVKTEDDVTVKQEKQENGEPMPPPAPTIKFEPNDSKTNMNNIPKHGQSPAVDHTNGNVKLENSENVKLEDIPVKEEEEESFMEIYTTNHYIGLQLVEGAKQLNLSREVNDWKAMCMSNEIYKAETMFLAIQHLKNTALPDDVFEPGEKKPQPAKKSRKRVASEEPSRQGSAPPAKRQAQGSEGVQSGQLQQPQGNQGKTLART
jgi:Poly(A) polymerase